ncbi:hypothetical protein TWF694_003381 [Orbilia ellipsospora]|uniref:F-box domain-containing protein n=1 Tax=Orbilia ellipsospora TaxID=2528407 RepID=A0AAV9X3Z8_9PEZI
MDNSKLEYIFPIPTELAFSILSFLNLEDLRSFALASQQCRALALPFLFRSLNITTDALSAFESDNRLTRICNSVRHVTLQTGNVTLKSGGCYDYFRLCLPGLPLFPNINSIKIYYKYRQTHAVFTSRQKRQARALNLAFFSAIFLHLSTLPFYSQLRYLYFTAEQEESPIYADTDTGSHSYDEINPLSQEAKNFLRVGVDVIVKDCKLPYPPALEELTIDTPFLFDPFFSKLHFGTTLTDSTVTLKKLHLKSALTTTPAERQTGFRNRESYLHFPIFPLPLTTIFPNVTTLSLAYDYMSPEYFQEVTLRFPNVEELKVCLGRSTTLRPLRTEDDEAYPFIDKFTCLRKLVIPWKKVRVSRSQIFPFYLSNSKLIKTVLGWYYRAGLKRLEDVVVWKKELARPLIDALHFKVNKDPKARCKVDLEIKASETLEGLLCGCMHESFGFKPDL